MAPAPGPGQSLYSPTSSQAAHHILGPYIFQLPAAARRNGPSIGPSQSLHCTALHCTALHGIMGTVYGDRFWCPCPYLIHLTMKVVLEHCQGNQLFVAPVNPLLGARIASEDHFGFSTFSGARSPLKVETGENWQECCRPYERATRVDDHLQGRLIVH
jgi:hypothetical protein